MYRQDRMITVCPERCGLMIESWLSQSHWTLVEASLPLEDHRDVGGRSYILCELAGDVQREHYLVFCFVTHSMMQSFMLVM